MFTLIPSRSTRSLCCLLILHAGWLVPVTGCGRASASFSVQPETVTRPSATITVHNQNLADIGVYVVVSGARFKLGAVESFRSRMFRVPRGIQLPSEIGLFVSARATDEHYYSPAITLMPGDEMVFTFENAAQFSSILRR